MDGGFNTGLRKVSDRITEDLPLVKDTYNYFTFTLLDSENNEIATNFNEFQIAHNIYTVYGQPLTDDISVELDNVETGATYLKQIFSKNSILPLKSPVHTVTVTRPVRKGADDDILHISVYEGNSRNLPESNKHWGRLSINGSKIQLDLVKGTEIELNFLLSESHDLSVSAYIPYTEQTFEQIFSPKEREVEIDWLQGELENLEERVDSEIDAAIEREDDQLKQEMSNLSNEVSRLREKADELADDDETDTKFQIDNEKMLLAQKINAALQDRESAFLLEQY